MSTVIGLLWTAGQLCVLVGAALDTVKSQRDMFPSYQSEDDLYQNVFIHAAVQGETHDGISSVGSAISAGGSNPALTVGELRFNGRNAFRQSKHPEGKLSVLTSPVSARNAHTEQRPRRFERASRRTNSPVGPKKRLENNASFLSNHGNLLEQEEDTLEKAAAWGDKAEAEDKAVPRGLRNRMLQRGTKAGNNFGTMLPHVNSSDRRDRKGRTEYGRGNDEEIHVGNLSTAPGVKGHPGFTSLTSKYEESKHTARAKEFLKEGRQAPGTHLHSGEFGKGPGGAKSCEKPDPGPGIFSKSQYDVVVEQNTSAREEGDEPLGRKVVEVLRVRPIFNGRTNSFYLLNRAQDQPHRAQGHSGGADKKQGALARRLAGGAEETGHRYAPAERYGSVDDTMPNSRFVDDKELVHASRLPHPLSEDLPKVFHSPLWSENSNDNNTRSSTKSSISDDDYEWEDAFTLDPGFRYPRLHRSGNSERVKDARQVGDAPEKTVSDYMPSAETVTAKKALAEEIISTGVLGHEPGTEHYGQYDYPGYSNLSGRLEEFGDDDYEVYTQGTANHGWDFQFVSKPSTSISGEDLEETLGDVGWEEDRFLDPFKTSYYETAGHPHLEPFDSHIGYSLDEDSSSLESAAAGWWPTPYNPYADDSSLQFDKMNMQASPHSGADNYYAERSADTEADTEASPWSIPFNPPADFPSGLSDNLGAQTPPWSRPYPYNEDSSSRIFDHWDALGPSSPEPYQDTSATPSRHFGSMGAKMPPLLSTYDYEEIPSQLFDHRHAQTPWSSPYQHSRDDSSVLFDSLGAQISSWSSPYNRYEKVPSRRSDYWDEEAPLWPASYQHSANDLSEHYESLGAQIFPQPSPYRYYANNPSRKPDHTDAQTPSRLFPSSLHYGPPIWGDDYGDNTESSFSDDFGGTPISYSEYIS